MASYYEGKISSIKGIGPKGLEEIRETINNVDLIQKDDQTRSAQGNNYYQLKEVVNKEILAGRLSRWIYCDGLTIKSCLDLDTTKTSYLDICVSNGVLACAVKHKNIFEEIITDRTAKTIRPDWSELYPPQKGHFYI